MHTAIDSAWLGRTEGFKLPSEKVRELRAKARHARELSDKVATDQQTIQNLKSYADDLDRAADKLEAELSVVNAADKVKSEPTTSPEAIAALSPKIAKNDGS